MSSPFETSSQFTDNNIPSTQNYSPTDEFTIKTMRDDLASIKSGNHADKLPQQSFSNQDIPSVSQPEVQTTVNNIPQPFPTQTSIESNMQEIPTQNVESNGSSFKIFITIAAILILSVLGLGGYYFLITKQTSTPIASQDNTVTQEPSAAIQQTQDQQPIAQEPQVQQQPQETPDTTTTQDQFSSEKPNYLVLDITTLSAQDIKKSLLDLQTKLASSQNSSLYEFIVVDKNNNPVAFPIFATAAKLNLTPNLLTDLGQNFSLYFYNDLGNIRLGLSTEVKNKAAFSQDLLAEEKTFPVDASLLYLNVMPDVKTGVFKSSTYNNFNIKYLNLNSLSTLSIDYCFNDSNFYLGTSKNTLRAILDNSKPVTNQTTISSTNQTSINTTSQSLDSDSTKQPSVTSSPTAISN